MNWLGEVVAKEVSPDDTVLDLGCGNLSTTGRLGACHLATDAFTPYLDAIKDSGPTMEFEIPFGLGFFRDDSFDIVLLLDVMEHCQECYHRSILFEAERIARKAVIVFSPEGMMKQEAFDCWGLGYNELQSHVSAVYASDFSKRGYEITDHETIGDNEETHDAFLAIKRA